MEELELKEFFKTFWRKKFQILIIVILMVIIGAVYTFKFTKPAYTASTNLVLLIKNNEQISEYEGPTADLSLNSQLILTYKEMIKSKDVIDDVETKLGTKIVESNIVVSAIKDTEIIKITISNSDPKLAADIANELGKTAVEYINSIYKLDNIEVLTEASVPKTPVNINHNKDLTTFGIIGLVIGVVYVVIKFIFDTKLKSSKQIEVLTDLNVLSNIYMSEDTKLNNKCFDLLKTNIQYTNNGQKTKTVLITSPKKSEGKSYTVSNLAVSFAKSNKKILLIDADIRTGIQASTFGVNSKNGLSNYLSDEENNDISSYIQKTSIDNLHLLAAGDNLQNPSDLLDSKKMDALLENLKNSYDIVLIDSVACDNLSDAIILSAKADSTVIVVAQNKTEKEDLEQTIKALKNVNGKIQGIVLNKVELEKTSKRRGK